MNLPEPVLPDPEVPGAISEPVDDPPLPTLPSTYEAARTRNAGGLVADVVETGATAIWVGAAAGFAFVAAPVAFALIADRDAFATFTERNLERLATLTYAGAAITALCAFARGRFEPAGRTNDVARCSAALLAVAGTAYHQRAIVPAMTQAQRAMGGFAETVASDPQRVAYRVMHKNSTRVYGTVLLLGVTQIALCAARSRT